MKNILIKIGPGPIDKMEACIRHGITGWFNISAVHIKVMLFYCLFQTQFLVGCCVIRFLWFSFDLKARGLNTPARGPPGPT